MFDRYNTVDVDDEKQAVKKSEGYMEIVNQSVDQHPFEDKKGISQIPANPL